ncbi:MAG: hypothetical protein N2035_03370 [Chthoniobacterales bacterium]|nr:hypothetical protein [Chthoniobacterales bacterium]
MFGIPERKYFRNLWNWIFAVLSETIGNPALSWYARLKVRWGKRNPKEWRKGILMGADHIGDILYRTASLEHLVQGLPECRWDWLVSPPADEVLENNPYISQIILRRKEENQTDLIYRLRRENYDVALCYDTGSYWPYLKLAIDAGIPNRVGYTHKGFSAWVTHPVPIHWPQPFIAYFRELVEFLVGEPCFSKLVPKIYIGEKEERKVNCYLAEKRIGGDDLFFVCSPFSRQPLSALVDGEKIIQVCNFIVNFLEKELKKEVKVIFSGSKDQLRKLESFAFRFGPKSVLCAGNLKVLEFAALLRRSKILVTQDSAPRHLANAVGTSIFFWTNRESHYIETGKYSENDFDLSVFEGKGFEEEKRYLETKLRAIYNL